MLIHIPPAVNAGEEILNNFGVGWRQSLGFVRVGMEIEEFQIRAGFFAMAAGPRTDFWWVLDPGHELPFAVDAGSRPETLFRFSGGSHVVGEV